MGMAMDQEIAVLFGNGVKDGDQRFLRLLGIALIVKIRIAPADLGQADGRTVLDRGTGAHRLLGANGSRGAFFVLQ